MSPPILGWRRLRFAIEKSGLLTRWRSEGFAQRRVNDALLQLSESALSGSPRLLR